MARNGRPFVFLHVGDLHMTQEWPAPASLNQPFPRDAVLLARQRRMEEDLKAILEDIAAAQPAEAAAFVYMPGDLAENGHVSEYKVIEKLWAAAKAALPLRFSPGDHDRGLGTMTDFTAFRKGFEGSAPPGGSGMPKAQTHEIDIPPSGWPPRPCPAQIEQYYFSEEKDGILCIFLDVVSAGQGRKGWGLDFRLGRGQFDWFVGELKKARQNGTTCAVFMHCYPAEFHESDEGAEIGSLIWNEGVRLVEIGHTHYSELAHDGRTTYGAVRSVGQNEDGPAGYAVVAIDDGEVSWRFRQVQQTWPFVMVSSPADRRLATRPLDRAEDGTIAVRALVLTDAANGPIDCMARVDGGAWWPLTPDCTAPGFVSGRVPWPDGSRILQVKATGARYPGWGKDLIDFDIVEPPPSDPVAFGVRPRPERPGSDASALSAWPDKGIRGDQLGPNKRGRKW